MRDSSRRGSRLTFIHSIRSRFVALTLDAPEFPATFHAGTNPLILFD